MTITPAHSPGNQLNDDQPKWQDGTLVLLPDKYIKMIWVICPSDDLLLHIYSLILLSLGLLTHQTEVISPTS